MRVFLSAMLLAGVAAARAETADGWLAVDDRQLAQACGGFDVGSGLLLSLGVERLVSINGTVVGSTHFSIPDMTQLSAAEARLASDAMAGMLVQNSLSDQAIRSQTTINATVANLALLKAVNFESSLREALNGAVGK
jgi:hypothetical protein